MNTNEKTESFKFIDIPTNNHGCEGQKVTVEVRFKKEFVDGWEEWNKPEFGTVVKETACTHQNCGCGKEFEVGQLVSLPEFYRGEWEKAARFFKNGNSFSIAGETNVNPSDLVVRRRMGR